MTLTECDVQRIEDLLKELPAMIEEHGYPYALGGAEYWLKRIVELSAHQKKGIGQ